MNALGTDVAIAVNNLTHRMNKRKRPNTKILLLFLEMLCPAIVQFIVLVLLYMVMH